MDKAAKEKSKKAEEKIRTLNLGDRNGVNILKRRYDSIKDFILYTVKEAGEITYQEVNDLAVEKLTGKFDGRIPWYVVSVKLDLEARGIIERVPKTSPHKIRLKQ